jgi:hypothetical protein
VVLLVVVIWFGFMRGGAQASTPNQIDVDINLPEGQPTRPPGN